MVSKDGTYYGWKENDGNITFIFDSPIKVAGCFMMGVEKLLKRTDGELVKFNLGNVKKVTKVRKFKGCENNDYSSRTGGANYLEEECSYEDNGNGVMVWICPYCKENRNQTKNGETNCKNLIYHKDGDVSQCNMFFNWSDDK